MALTGIYRVQALRRAGTAADWTAESTIVLANGEIGVETDSGKAKMGDGVTAWSALSYVSTSSGSQSTPAVTSVAGKTGVVTLAVADVSGAAPIASPTFTGTVTVPTLTLGNSSTGAASTAFVAAAIAAIPAYVLPQAAHSTVGGVKTAAFMAALSAAPTQQDINGLIQKLIDAGIMDAS